MYIIKFQGGLGNQMFQYALYLKLMSLGEEVKADLSSYEDASRGGTYRRFLLEKIWGISVDNASKEEINRLYADNQRIIKRALIKRIGKKTYYKEHTETFIYRPEIFNKGSKYLDGYWQSEKYFTGIEQTIREAFKFKDNTFFYPEKNSVAIHVRMGDYLDSDCQRLYGNICSKEYYLRAINVIDKRIPISKIFVFSDEIDRAKYLLGFDRKYVYEESKIDTPEWEDLVKMSLCNHQIIANSSYSWWAAWLNRYSNKIVVAPRMWTNYSSSKDVIPYNWIRI